MRKLDRAEYKGGCLCGAVQYGLTSLPNEMSHCYCRQCQRQHGAAFASYINIASDSISFLDNEGALAAFASSPCVQRLFCKKCGSNVAWKSKQYPEFTAVVLASLDDAPCFDRVNEYFAEEKPAWLSKA